MLDLKKISERIDAQNNRVTANPLFCVFEKERIYGIDPDLVECPYCGHENDPDCECVEEDEDCEMYCLNCGNTFMYVVGYIRVYSPRKVPCLNGEEHNYKKTHTIPARLRCEYCGEEKSL